MFLQRLWGVFVLAGLFSTPSVAAPPRTISMAAASTAVPVIMNPMKREMLRFQREFLRQASRLPQGSTFTAWKALFTADAAEACEEALKQWKSVSPSLQSKLLRLQKNAHFRSSYWTWRCSGLQFLATRLALTWKPSPSVAKLVHQEWNRVFRTTVNPKKRAHWNWLLFALLRHLRHLPQWEKVLWKILAFPQLFVHRDKVFEYWKSLSKVDLVRFLRGYKHLSKAQQKAFRLRFVLSNRNLIYSVLENSLLKLPHHPLLESLLRTRIQQDHADTKRFAMMYWNQIPAKRQPLLRWLLRLWKKTNSLQKTEIQNFFHVPTQTRNLLTLAFSEPALRKTTVALILAMYPGIPFGVKTLGVLWVLLLLFWGVRKLFAQPSPD